MQNMQEVKAHTFIFGVHPLYYIDKITNEAVGLLNKLRRLIPYGKNTKSARSMAWGRFAYR